MVVVVYWRARLAVNEEVRVQSPPITPTGCGSMAGHLARNQVHAGSIPAAQTSPESADEWSSTGPENRGGGDEPQRFDSSTLVCHQFGPFGYQLGCRSFKAAKRGQHPHGLPHSACRVRLAGRGRCPLKAETRVQIPHATHEEQFPPASGSRPGLRIQAQAFESPRGD